MEPQQSFDRFGFTPFILNAVKQAGFVAPTPIQDRAIPEIMQGRDVLGLAQTGTGKTAAFALPIINSLMALDASKHPRVLVIVPTRELALQVHETFEQFAQDSGIYSTTIFGGVGFNQQVRELRRGVEVVVACPGRLLDHIQQRTIDLRSIQTLVLDEADQMFDMGFLPTIRRILRILPQPRHNLMFSATMPQEVRRLALEVLKDPVSIEISKSTAAETVSHALYPVSGNLKLALLCQLLKSICTESVLVFTRTKHKARKLAMDLQRQGHVVSSLHGNLSQGQRTKALEGFRTGKYQILVATDIASRGLDISSVTHVVNFDVPDTVEAYIHRIGRTGRAARNGDALTLVAGEDHLMVPAIERRLGFKIERRKVEGFNYST